MKYIQNERIRSHEIEIMTPDFLKLASAIPGLLENRNLIQSVE